MKETLPEDLRRRLESKGEKTFAFVVLDRDEEVITSYRYDPETMTSLSTPLKDLVELLNGAHAAMRMELCGGW